MFATSDVRKHEELVTVLEWFEQVAHVRNTVEDERTRIHFETMVMLELQENIKTIFAKSPYSHLVEFSNVLAIQSFVELRATLLEFRDVVVSLEPLLLSIELRLNQKSVVHD